MKKLLGLMFATLLCFGATACAETPRIVLMTCYVQEGWGDRIEVGYVDESGGLWYFERESNDLGFPYSVEERLDFLGKQTVAQQIGTLDEQALLDAASLIACVSGDDIQPGGDANDAGTQSSYAVRYASDGARETVLLGSSSDTAAENMDANAQALYALLRQAFPGVTDYEGQWMIAPSGFQAKPLLEFAGLTGAELRGATVEVSDYDCEAGALPRETTEDEARAFLEALPKCKVTGKQNALSVTGGTVLYTLYSAEGERIATLEFYHGALVRPDGMYTVVSAQ